MMVALPVSAHLNYGPMRMLLYEVAPGLTVGSAILKGDLHGVYDLLRDTIVIDRGMTYTRKRCTLVHELVHRAYGIMGISASTGAGSSPPGSSSTRGSTRAPRPCTRVTRG